MINAVQTLTGNAKETGIQGLSAYEVYKKNGGTLTEEEWLLSLNGITPTIGENGNWYLGDADTGLPSRGEKGAAGSVNFIVVNELPSEDIDESAIYMKPIIKGIEWNGDTTGKEVITDNGMNYYKVSDKVLTHEELLGQKLTFYGPGEEISEYTIGPNDYAEIVSGRTIVFCEGKIPGMLVVTETTDTNPYSTGIYFLKVEMEGMSAYIGLFSYAEGQITYEEYIYVNGAWESLGTPSVEVDLTNYPTKEEVKETTGELDNLATKDKTNLVNAINEVANNSSGGSALPIYELFINQVLSLKDSFSYKGLGTTERTKLGEFITDAYSKGYETFAVLVRTNNSAHNQTLLHTIGGSGDKIQDKPSYIALTSISSPYILNGSKFDIYSTYLSIRLTWSDNEATVESSDISNGKATVMTVTNTTAFTPTSDYHPANKKYVDDAIAALKAELQG